MSDTNSKLIIAMARAYNELFLKIEKNIQEFGLHISEFGVLEMLLHKGEQPIQKVAEKILVTSGTVTYVIDKLQKNQLVQRKKSEKDKRIIYVLLTSQGESLIREIFPKHQAFLNELLKSMDEDFKKDLMTKLKLLHETIKEN